MTLGGYICVRNGISLDYNWELAARSLLNVCSELVMADCDSTDGTREAMDRMADKDARIRVINFPWTTPKGCGADWWINFLNHARAHLTTKHQITLDADEVLDDSPECLTAIREACAAGNPARRFTRLNYWKDPFHLIPSGHCCSPCVARMGLTEMRMPTDQPTKPGEFPINEAAIHDPRLVIHHLGFLRKPEHFYAKSKAVQSIWVNNYDERLAKVEAQGKHQSDIENCEWTNNLVPWEGYMPDSAQQWLSARGHHTQNYIGMNEREQYMRVQVVPPPPAGEPLNVLVVGDLGDIIHGMAIFKAIGKVNVFARDANHLCKRIVHRMPLIAPLLRSQNYVTDFTEHTDQQLHWNAGDFRSKHETTRSLAWAHLMHYRGNLNLPPISPDLYSPWLTGIEPDPRANGRIIINRTNRYPNRLFRWMEIVRHYGDRLLFVGNPEEHRDFCSTFAPVPYQPTADLLEVAQLIAGSEMFIGNQSACFAVAEGMKHPRLLEVCLDQPDVIVTREGTGNVSYSADGALDIPPMAGTPALKCLGTLSKVNYLKNPSIQPRTGWRIGPPHSRQDHRDVSYSTLKRSLMKAEGLPDDKAHRAIFDALAAREPDYFAGGQQQAVLMMYQSAVANAL